MFQIKLFAFVKRRRFAVWPQAAQFVDLENYTLNAPRMSHQRYIQINIYVYIICTKENRLPTNKNFIQTHRLSASAFTRSFYIGLINPLMISSYDVLLSPGATHYVHANRRRKLRTLTLIHLAVNSNIHELTYCDKLGSF